MNKFELKKLKLKEKLKRLEWNKELELEHRWSMFAIKVGAILFGILAMIKFLFSGWGIVL